MIIKNATLIDCEGIYKKDLYIKNNLISDTAYGDVIDCTGCFVMPGLINAHTHLAMSMLRGVADDLPLQKWLNSVIFPIEKKFVNKETVYWSSLLSMMEMISTGTTCFVDMYYFENQVAKAAVDIGMRGFVGEGALDFSPNSNNSDTVIKRIENLIIRYKDGELVRPIIAPHSLYLTKETTLKKLLELSKKYDVPVTIHASETDGEVKMILEQYGKRPIAMLDKLGLLTEKTVVAHAVKLTDNDISLLEKSEATVAHNIKSNLKLASGIMPISKMSRINIALGTDGAASNNKQNLFSEMNTAALIHKGVSGDPTISDAQSIFKMATFNPAGPLGIKVGKLSPGYMADLIIIKPDALSSIPIYNPYSYLVYSFSHSDIKTVIINGKIVYENGRFSFINAAKVKSKISILSKEVQSFANRKTY